MEKVQIEMIAYDLMHPYASILNHVRTKEDDGWNTLKFIMQDLIAYMDQFKSVDIAKLTISSDIIDAEFPLSSIIKMIDDNVINKFFTYPEEVLEPVYCIVKSKIAILLSTGQFFNR